MLHFGKNLICAIVNKKKPGHYLHLQLQRDLIPCYLVCTYTLFIYIEKNCLNTGPQSKSKQKKILESDNYDLSLAEVHTTSGL